MTARGEKSQARRGLLWWAGVIVALVALATCVAVWELGRGGAAPRTDAQETRATGSPRKDTPTKPTPPSRAQVLAVLRRLQRLEESAEPALGLVWFKPWGTARYESKGGLCVYPYLGVDETGRYWTRLYVRCRGRSWLFPQRLIVRVDGTSHEVVLDRMRDVDSEVLEGGSTWEKVDLADQEPLIRAMHGGRDVYVTLAGSHRRDSYQFDWEDGVRFGAIVLALDELGKLEAEAAGP